MWGQSPANLPSTITWDASPSTPSATATVDDIQNAFNNARNQEELQFPSLAVGSITNLSMPTQAVWDAMSSEERILFLLNDERKARKGLNYGNGNGPVKGWTFIGIEANITAIAVAEAQTKLASGSWAAATNIFGVAPGIDGNATTGGSGCNNFVGTQPDCCHQHSPKSQSTRYYYSGTMSTAIVKPQIEAVAVYEWIYRSNNSRETCLLQDDNLAVSAVEPFGFIDDYGNPEEEGFIGVGIASGGPFTSSNGTVWNHVDIPVLAYFDPVPQSEGCNYVCTSCIPCPNNITENSNPIPTKVYQANNWVKSAGKVPSSGDVTFQAEMYVQLDPIFETVLGAAFLAQIDECFLSGN